MYHMKNILSYDSDIYLPKCMYRMKNLNETKKSSEVDINISNQTSNNNMTELEKRQDQLLKKLDILYESIKTISLICTGNNNGSIKSNLASIPVPEEIVLNINPDKIPWYLNVFLKDSSVVANITWHIHSSVPNEKVEQIKAYVKNLKLTNNESNINFRLIFKCGSADSELKYSSLTIPIVGSINILRYFSLVYPTTVQYDLDDYYMESLLDLCYLYEKASEKDKQPILQSLFAQHNDWIYNNTFSIVDLAAYSAIKQSKNKPKSIPKDWFERCEKMCA